MVDYDLSYIIATKNRLPYLQILLERLIASLSEQDEIVVVDGDSNDGSKDYLQNLFENGKINQYVTEPDQNQAHGWNKAMLLAKGKIIKKVMDDDVFSFHEIKKCARYMLERPHIDLCISNCLVSNTRNSSLITFASRLNEFERWKSLEEASFSFSDVSMLIRRSSLSFIGLYDTQFIMIDWEYSLRASFLKAKIAYFTGCNAMAVYTPENVSSKVSAGTLKDEGRIGRIKYGYPGDASYISLYSKIKITIGKVLKYEKERTFRGQALVEKLELVPLYDKFYKELNAFNEGKDGIFIHS